jgi:type 1 glutamine amidotransferase
MSESMRRSRSASIMAILLCLVTATTAGARRRNLLVVTETAGFHHASIPAAERLLETLDRRSRRWDATFLATASDLGPEQLANADAVAFVNTSGELPLDPDQRAALLAFVRSGKGFLGTHSASDTFHAWPEYLAMLGGEFLAHPHVGDGTVVVEDRRHPATRALPRRFRIAEEFYFFRTNPRNDAHVLARLDVGSVGGDASEDRPLVWCRREGNGRVFYDALGHFDETWSDPRQRAILAGGIAWVLRLRRGACD